MKILGYQEIRANGGVAENTDFFLYLLMKMNVGG
jgi:hypothetical protein